MRYQGGKSKLAKQIAAAIREHGKHVQGSPIWEPFCGGLGMTPALASLGPVICSDVEPSLIALYKAWCEGWRPPAEVTAEDYAAHRKMSDDNPAKAFIRWGCSFGGIGHSYGRDPRGPGYYAQQTARALAKQIHTATSFDCLSFFDVAPRAGLTLYLDPPYASTDADYVRGWDAEAFWSRAREWAAFGPVYVSEFNAPEGWTAIWEKVRTSTVAQTEKRVLTEKLFVCA
jgi:DNA adenine methylase